jgi:MFS family permease
MGAELDAAPVRPLAAFSVPNYRRFVIGQSISLVGSWTETVAQALLVLQLTNSGVWLGLATAARYLPVLLLTPYAGLIVDRHDKRTVLLVTQASLAAVSLVLGIVVLLGAIQLWMVFAVARQSGAHGIHPGDGRTGTDPQRHHPQQHARSPLGSSPRPVVAAALVAGRRCRLVLRGPTARPTLTKGQRCQFRWRAGLASDPECLPAERRRPRRTPRPPAA